MRRITQSVKLGVIVPAVAAVAGFGSVSMLDKHTITITAQFDNVNGLYTGNPVSVLGMPVGKVTAIRPYGSHIDVDLSVDAAAEIPADAQAVIVSDSVLTDRHIEMTPVYRGGPTLGDHTVLDGDHTKTPVEFDSLIAMADKISTSLGGDGHGGGPVAGLMNLGAALTAGNGDNTRAALGELATALQLGPDHGAATANAIQKIITNLNALAGQADRNDQTLRQFGSGIRQLSGMLADENVGQGDTGTELNDIVVESTDLLRRNRQNLRDTVANSTVITKSLADYNDNLAEFLDVFPLVTDNAYNAIDRRVGAVRAGVDLNRILLDGQMAKEACNLLGLKQLGCATGTVKDMGPDFGYVELLHAMAGMPDK